MLSLLHIENIAIIEAVDIEFGGGFNVLTGETGAGKTALLSACKPFWGSAPAGS